MTNSVTSKKPAATTSQDWTDAQRNFIEAKAQNTKTGKFSNEDVKQLVKDPIFASAEKTVPQLRGKIISMGYYDKSLTPAAAKPEGEAPTRKADYVRGLETLVGADKEALATFEKASKPQLELACSLLTKRSDRLVADALKKFGITQAQIEAKMVEDAKKA